MDIVKIIALSLAGVMLAAVLRQHSPEYGIYAALAAGILIIVIHVAVMVILAKVLKMDIFTCAVASLANIGGTATAPVLAGAYSSALVPVGIVMALLGYVIGTGGGLLVANLMRLLG